MTAAESSRALGLLLGTIAFSCFSGCITNGELPVGSSPATIANVSQSKALGLLSPASKLESVGDKPKVATDKHNPSIQPVGFVQDEDETSSELNAVADASVDSSPTTESHSTTDAKASKRYDLNSPTGMTATDDFPIDLPTALRLAGADNLQVVFAAEQVQQALARVDAADALWLPSVRFGIGYNNHAGRIQATEGNVIEAARSSLFVGGGLGTGNAPITGGAGGPARMLVDLSLVDVLFEPLAARQAADAAQANQSATFNDTLLATSIAHIELVRAHSEVVIATEAVENAQELLKLTKDFAETGRGLQADANRAGAELASRRRDALRAEEAVVTASAELARILRLDPTVRLVPIKIQPVSVELVDGSADIHELIAQAQALRPELSQANAQLMETCTRIRQEKLRPVLPHVYTGFSGGGFGGSPGADASNFNDRTDFDIGVAWEMRNLGLGNRALQAEQLSIHRQAHVSRDAIREQIAAEVTMAREQVRLRNQQLAIAEKQVRSAKRALELNLDGIRGGVLRPIEIQQAIGALAAARRQHVDSVTDYNEAQFALLRAIGQPFTGNDAGQQACLVDE